MESRECLALAVIVAIIVGYALYTNIDNIVGAVTEPFAKQAQINEDNCRNHCNGIDALGFTLDGVDCKCHFDVSNCKGYCTNIGAYAYDFPDNNCRCWFK